MNWVWSTRAVMMVCGILAAGSVNAAWVLVDDFSSLTPGPGINGQNGWVDVTSLTGDAIPDFNVVADPDDSGNQVLQVVRTHNSWDSTAYKPLGVNSIPQGGSGTLFYRIRQFLNPTAPRGTAGVGTVPGGDLSTGASDVAPAANSNGGGFGDFETQVVFAGTATTPEVRIRTLPGTANQVVGNYTHDLWTNVWVAIDNAADTYTLYTSEGNDPAVLRGTGGFRNGLAANDLISFYIRSGFGQTVGGRNETGLLDDIYVDNTGINLANPTLVPEPTSWLLLATALTACVATRGRGRRSLA